MTNYTKKRQRQNGRQERNQGPAMMSDYQMFRMKQHFNKEADRIDKAIINGLLPHINFKLIEND